MGKRYKPIIPEGTHLASSKNTYGAKRGALLDNDTNKVVGQAEFVEEEEDEYNYSKSENSSSSSLGKGLLAGGVAVGILAAALCANKRNTESYALSEEERIKNEIKLERLRQKEIRKYERRDKRNAIIKKYLKIGIVYCCKGMWTAVKYVIVFAICCIKKISIWLFEKLKVGIVKLRERKQAAKLLKETKEAGIYGETNENSYASLLMNPAKFSDVIDEVFENFQSNMTSEDAQLRLIRILLLSNELAKEIRELQIDSTYNNVNINMDYNVWRRNMEKLTTEKMAGYINYIIANNGNNIESNVMDALIMNFYGGIYENQEFIPIRADRIKEALRLNLG